MDASVTLPLTVVFLSLALAAWTGAQLWLTPRAVRQRVASLSVPAAESGHAAVAGVHAGLWTTRTTSARRVTPATLLLPLTAMALVLSWSGTDARGMALAGLAAVGAWRLPVVLQERAREARRTAIRHGLPDAIDLLIVCIESGSGLDQAISRVGDELVLAHPALADEFTRITAESRAGTPRLEAFRRSAERTGLDEMRSLVTLLTQADRFGTSVGQALRTHAEAARVRRRQEAEERAAKLAVKLLFPLVFCLFPAFYLVVLGPSILQIFRVFIWGGLNL